MYIIEDMGEPVKVVILAGGMGTHLAVQNKACPVKIYVGVLELIAGEYSVLEPGNDGCAVFAEDFQKTIQCLFGERGEVVPFPGVWLHEPGMSMFDAEVAAEFAGGEGFDQGANVDSFLFQRGEEGRSSLLLFQVSLRHSASPRPRSPG